MKSAVLLSTLATAALTSAFVAPDQVVFSQLAAEQHRDSLSNLFDDAVSSVKTSVKDTSSTLEDIFGSAVDKTNDFVGDVFGFMRSGVQQFEDQVEETGESVSEFIDEAPEMFEEHMGTLYDNAAEFFGPPREHHHHDHDHDHDHPHPPHRGRPGHGRPPHHGPSNKTVYELIASSKYTTKLAKLINEYDDLVFLLNSTSANFTIFAPIDKAFDKIPKDAPKPPKDVLKKIIKKILSYHVIPEAYPAGKILKTSTIGTLLPGDRLSNNATKTPQRVSINLGLRGLTVNFIPRIVAVDIFGTNGVIHGIDNFLIPPPTTYEIVELVPRRFSTLNLALIKTGLDQKADSTNHTSGGTSFFPDNNAFDRLGRKANAFLFSKHGLKYLKALLGYHHAPNITLYNDAAYFADSDREEEPTHPRDPRTNFHVDLKTMLHGKSLSIDIGSYAGGFIKFFTINGFTGVKTPNIAARDGVVHVVEKVLIPPKTLNGESVMYEGGEIEVEDLKERLEPYLDL